MRYNPNEDEFIDLCNTKDIVVVLCHGPGNQFTSSQYYDKNGAFCGLALGGNSTHPDDQVNWGAPGSGARGNIAANWITANELHGKINNPRLTVVAAACEVGRTNRLWKAIYSGSGRISGHFVSTEAKISAGGTKGLFQYVVDLVNTRNWNTADGKLPKGKSYVVNPTNDDFR